MALMVSEEKLRGLLNDLLDQFYVRELYPAEMADKWVEKIIEKCKENT